VSRRIAFTNRDRAALLVGAGLVLAMLIWFSWRMVRTISRERALEKPSVTPAQGH
jgi:hypothetical protein